MNPVITNSLGKFQSTPPVKAATILQIAQLFRHKISIHAAREGGDGGTDKEEVPNIISIHAAREGGDVDAHAAGAKRQYFNPRRP